MAGCIGRAPDGVSLGLLLGLHPGVHGAAISLALQLEG